MKRLMHKNSKYIQASLSLSNADIWNFKEALKDALIYDECPYGEIAYLVREIAPTVKSVARQFGIKDSDYEFVVSPHYQRIIIHIFDVEEHKIALIYDYVESSNTLFFPYDSDKEYSSDFVCVTDVEMLKGW